jgi:outer membrane protein TolC
VDPSREPDPTALLAQPPLRPADLTAAELEHSIQRCRQAVEDARRNLHSAQDALADAEKAVEQAVMAQAFLRCVAPHASEAP